MTPFGKQLTEDVFVEGQISLEQIAEIAASGIKAIIINRPDGEQPEQPMAAEITHEAKEAGLEVSYIPMIPGRLSLELIQDTAAALNDLPQPVLAYCASGTRSTILWCSANVSELGVDVVLNKAAAAGYDLEQIRPALEQLKAQ